MKIPLAAIALSVIVEIKAYEWMTYGAIPGNGRRYYPSQGSWWPYPQQQSQNIGSESNVEWVCRNPRTNDMMIIASDNTRQTYPTTKPWQWQTFPPGHHQHHQHQHHGNDWTGPIIIVEQEQESNQLLTPSPENNNNNNNNNDNNDNNSPTTTPRYHGGEGMIDIRSGQ